MNTISDSAVPWNTNVEVAVAPQGALNRTDGDRNGGEESKDGFKIFGDDGFTFLDFLDIINPLQHLPIIGMLYRNITDDTLDPGSRVIGGTLFMGPVGTVVSIANVLIDDTTGKDMGEHFLAFFEDEQLELTDSDVPKAGPAIVADVGARSFAPPGATMIQPSPGQAQENPQSGVQMAMLDAAEPLDPVTAWAMSETAYRNSAVGKPTPRPDETIPGSIPLGGPGILPGNWRAVPDRERADLPANAYPSTLEAADAIKDARAASAFYAATSYGRAKPTPDQEIRNMSFNKPPGAIANEGGWFTDTMLTALGKYRDGADLGTQEKPAVVDLNR